MSGLEVVGLAMAVIAAIRVLPEIPKVWRKAMGSTASTGIETRSHREYRDSRTGQQTFIDQRVTQANNKVMVQETMRTVRDVSNHHAMVHISSNQLQGIVWDHTARTTDKFVDVVQHQFQQMHDDHVHVRTLLLCLMVIVGFFAYLLGTSKGENKVLRALLRTEGAAMPAFDDADSIDLAQTLSAILSPVWSFFGTLLRLPLVLGAKLGSLTLWLLSMPLSLFSTLWSNLKPVMWTSSVQSLFKGFAPSPLPWLLDFWITFNFHSSSVPLPETLQKAVGVILLCCGTLLCLQFLFIQVMVLSDRREERPTDHHTIGFVAIVLSLGILKLIILWTLGLETTWLLDISFGWDVLWLILTW